MTQRQTSIAAYHNLNMHRVNSQIGHILQTIKDSEIALNDRRIAQKTGYAINIVESRCSLLEQENLIVRDEILDCKTGNYSRAWRLKP